MKLNLNPIDNAIMATFPHNVPCKATEAASIRSQLRLRLSNTGKKEVYTTIHGTQIWRWFEVSDSDFEWYRSHFNLKVENIPTTSISEAELEEILAESFKKEMK